MLFYQNCIYYTWKNIKKSYRNNISKISALTQNEKFEVLDDYILYSRLFSVFNQKNMKH